MVVACDWWRGACTVLVIRCRDGHEVWGDTPVPCPSPEAMPDAAERRLAGPVAWRRGIGPWRRMETLRGARWTAPAELADDDEGWFAMGND